MQILPQVTAQSSTVIPLTRTFADPKTLRATRQRRAMTAAQLADHLGRSASFVSRAENEESRITGDDLAACAAVLNVSEELLATPLPEQAPEGVHFRGQSVSKLVQDQLIQHANYAGWMLNRLHEHTVDEVVHPRHLPQIDIELLDGPEDVARAVRAQWKLRGPVTDLAQKLEGAGVMILPMPPGVERVDAISVRASGPVCAVILLNQAMPHNQQRHTLAHELGHLVMDEARLFAVDHKEREEQADRFAAEFLAPYAELRGLLHQITPSQQSKLEDLRSIWGVSLSALIRRAYLNGGITESQYRYWFRYLNANGLLQDTRPSTYPVHPQEAARFLQGLQANRYSAADIAKITMTRPSELQSIFGELWPFAWIRPALAVV